MTERPEFSDVKQHPMDFLPSGLPSIILISQFALIFFILIGAEGRLLRVAGQCVHTCTIINTYDFYMFYCITSVRSVIAPLPVVGWGPWLASFLEHKKVAPSFFISSSVKPSCGLGRKYPICAASGVCLSVCICVCVCVCVSRWRGQGASVTPCVTDALKQTSRKNESVLRRACLIQILILNQKSKASRDPSWSRWSPI